MAAACNFTVSTDLCTLDTCCLEQGPINYQPSLVGNAIYAGFFGAILLAQIVLVLVYRSTYSFFIGMACGLVLEIVGYAGRIQLHGDPFSLNNFIIYLVCLTIGPAFIMASIYLSFNRVVVAYGEQYGCLRPRAYALTCICFDLIALILQAVGGALAATGAGAEAATTGGGDDGSANQVTTGTHIMVAGLAFQLFSTVTFVGLCIDFALRMRRGRRSGDEPNPAFVGVVSTTRFRAFLVALALATVTIFIRSAFRVDELKDGFGSDAANNQTLFMIFEGPMIIAAGLALSVLHPGFAFRGKYGAAGWGFSSRSSPSSAAARKSKSSDREELQEASSVEYDMQVMSAARK